LAVFKDQYSDNNQTMTNAYIFSSHKSDIIDTIHRKLEYLSALKRDEENEAKIKNQLSILEPALVNDMNLEIALSANIHTVLLKFIDPKTLASKESKL